MLSPSTSVRLRDNRKVTSRDLYIESIHLTPTLGLAYYKLGVHLPVGKVLELRDRRALSEQQLYMEALRHDPSIADAYYRLGVMLESGQTISLAGRDVTEQDLYVLTLAKDPRKATAYFNLAGTLLEDSNGKGTITLHDGRTLSGRELLLEAIDVDRTYSEAYCNLAADLGTTPSETVRLKDGRVMTQLELLSNAIECAPAKTLFSNVEYAVVFGQLATLLTASTTTTTTPGQQQQVIMLKGESMSVQDLWLAAIHCDATCAFAYLGLGKKLASGGTAKLRDGRTLTKKELFAMAIHHDPDSVGGYHALAGGAGTCIVLMDGREFTKEALAGMKQGNL